MAKNAYCSECGTRVNLSESGECVRGHARSALRDVREGALAAAPVASSVPSSRREDFAPPTGLASQVIGKAIVLVPAAFVVLLALWSGYAGGAGMGLSPLMSWLSSIGSLALTAAGVWLWVWMRRRRQR